MQDDNMPDTKLDAIADASTAAQPKKKRLTPAERAQRDVDRIEAKMADAKRRARNARLRDCLAHLNIAHASLCVGDTGWDETILEACNAIRRELGE